MKKLWALFFYCTCATLHGTDYHVSLINLENGGFKFFVLHGSKTGHVKGVFGKNEQKTWLLPEPEMTVTFPGYLHHFFKSYGIVTFAIGGFFVKIESDRSVFLWGADPKKDRVYIYTNTNFGKQFRLDCKGVKAPVFFRTNGQNYEWIDTKKYDIPSPEIAGKDYRIPNIDGKKKK